MLTLLFVICMFGIFGKLIGLAFKMTWGIAEGAVHTGIPASYSGRIGNGWPFGCCISASDRDRNCIAGSGIAEGLKNRMEKCSMRRSDEFQPADLKGISMIPFGLLAGFMDEKEIRITELAEEDFGFLTVGEGSQTEILLRMFL